MNKADFNRKFKKDHEMEIHDGHGNPHKVGIYHNQDKTEWCQVLEERNEFRTSSSDYPYEYGKWEKFES